MDVERDKVGLGGGVEREEDGRKNEEVDACRKRVILYNNCLN